MKLLIPAVLAILVALSVSVSGELSFTIPASDPGFQYMGRFEPTNFSTSFDWASSTIAFTLYRKAGPGPGGYQAALLLSDTGSNWYKVFVNNVHAFDFPTDPKTVEYPLTGLDFQYEIAYEIVVIKRTEASNSNDPSVFIGLALNDAAVELLTQAPAQRRMFFFGDSITCGYADLGNYNSNCDQASSNLEDNYLAYGPLTARSFGADYQVVSWSGKGVVHNYGDPNLPSVCPNCPMPYYFNKTIGTDPSVIYPFQNFVPDVIVSNLGTNDFSDPEPSPEMFEAGYLQLIDQFQQAYPRATVFLACGPMTTSQVCSYVQNVATTAGLTYINQMVVDPQDQSLWSCGHPNAAGQNEMAQAMIQVISKTMGWVVNATSQ